MLTFIHTCIHLSIHTATPSHTFKFPVESRVTTIDEHANSRLFYYLLPTTVKGRKTPSKKLAKPSQKINKNREIP